MSPLERYLTDRYDGFLVMDLLCLENELLVKSQKESEALRREVRDLLGVKKLPKDVEFSKKDFFLLVEILL